jgi:hypothetical protein
MAGKHDNFGGSMSGTIILTPNPGDDWATAWLQVEYARKGKIGLSLTNFDNNSLPAIASGSWAEVVGSIYKWTTEEAISGSLVSSAINYIKLVPSGSGESAIVTATWTTSAPAWSDTYQGYYSGTSRYIGGCYYNGTYYLGKWIYNKDDLIRKKVLVIGDWNMDSTDYVLIAHGLPLSNIRSINVTIRDDNNTTAVFYSSPYKSTDYDYFELFHYTDQTNVTIQRRTGGLFDSVVFDSTGYNRGWIMIWYEV